MAKPKKGVKHREPYDHDPLVMINDYTKNISQEIHNPGQMPSWVGSMYSKGSKSVGKMQTRASTAQLRDSKLGGNPSSMTQQERMRKMQDLVDRRAQRAQVKKEKGKSKQDDTVSIASSLKQIVALKKKLEENRGKQK